MSIYRYTRRSPVEVGTPPPPAVEVTLTNPDFKAELDRTMDRMGFDFAGSHEERLNAVAPGFPVASAVAARTAETLSENFLADRPTPVAPHRVVGAPGAMTGASTDAGDASFDVAALGISPSWEEPHQTEHSFTAAPDRAEVPPVPAFGLPGVQERAREFLWVAVALAPALLVHAGVLGSAPTAEDFVRLYDGASQGFVHVVTKHEGVHSLLLSRILVWLLHRVFSLHTGWLFLFPLSLHLASVVYMRRILVALTERPVLSALVAAAWGIAPLHRGTLDALYSSGAVLATTLSLAVIDGFATARSRDDFVSPLRVLAWNALLVVSALASTTGTALAVAMPVFVLLGTRREDPQRRIAVRLVPAAVAAVAVYVAARLLGPPDPLGRFIRGIPLFAELFGYGVGNLVVGPFVLVTPGGASAALIGNPTPGAAVVIAGAVSFLLLTALAWAVARRAGVARRAAAFAVFPATVYLLAAFDGAKFVVRDGIPVIAVGPEPHYAALAGVALAVGLVAASAPPPAFRQRFLAPAIACGVGLFGTLLSWAAASHLGDLGAPMTKSLNDAERALERAAGATEAGHEAYFDNVDVPFVPRATVGRDRSRFPGLLAYFALAHPGGELAGHKVIFVESDGKLVVRLRTTTLPKVADLVESMDEARQKGHSVTTPRLLGSTAGMEGSAGPRRPSRPAPTRRPLPFAKPEEKPK